MTDILFAFVTAYFPAIELQSVVLVSNPSVPNVMMNMLLFGVSVVAVPVWVVLLHIQLVAMRSLFLSVGSGDGFLVFVVVVAVGSVVVAVGVGVGVGVVVFFCVFM